ncbi:hypothetical protein L6164_004423 [Bauhinia variegata]|uniref:Uncharacterized protein n=1 Tax=Bauhinia variegata TaxID=167791 RepID=A0ACB9Q3W2_BAUVA|nr:hypothetical protein L6164_004423 [Bauhinia variegata]
MAEPEDAPFRANTKRYRVQSETQTIQPPPTQTSASLFKISMLEFVAKEETRLKSLCREEYDKFMSQISKLAELEGKLGKMNFEMDKFFMPLSVLKKQKDKLTREKTELCLRRRVAIAESRALAVERKLWEAEKEITELEKKNQLLRDQINDHNNIYPRLATHWSCSPRLNF